MVDPVAGEVWTVWLDPVVGHVQGGVRPALVVSNADYNGVPHGLRIVVPITSTNRGVVLHLAIEPPEGGISRSSVLLCEQVSAQSVERFRRRRGTVSAETLARVQAIVAMFF